MNLSEDIKNRTFKKSISDKNYTDIVKTNYKYLIYKYGYTLRISNLFELLKTSFAINEFELLDFKNSDINSQFESYLMDEFINWKNGKVIDFSDIYRSIVTVGEFSKIELDIFEKGNIEEVLWSIFLAISNYNIEDLLK